MQDLPIGISEFSELREKNKVYVDKTKHVYRLLKIDSRTFLSRPRRFGKSLFLSTLEAALQGKKELFKGLWIEKSDYTWPLYGVIRLDFSELSAANLKDFKEKFIFILLKSAKENGIVLEKTDNIDLLFMELISQLYNGLADQKRPVALLIDEYDSPILHALQNRALAEEFREVIKRFALIAKANQSRIQFVFIAGVSAFSKSGLSSGLNNLDNLTMDEKSYDICGYTNEEVDRYFKEHIQAWSEARKIPYAEIRENLRTWYNGYSFKENTPTIYSPFSLTCSLKKQEVYNFWFESATPQFLLDELGRAERNEECRFLSLEEFVGGMSLLQTFEIENIPLTALLFQMGYLTLDRYDPETRLYTLKYPNLEVKTALNKHLLIVLTKISPAPFDSLLAKLFAALKQENIDELIECFRTVFRKIPYQLYQEAEKFYHAVLQALFISADLQSHAEYSTAQGRADLIIDYSSALYVLELKVGQPAKSALKQIESKRYYEPFMKKNKPIHAIGISFARKKGSKKEAGDFLITYATKKIEL
jgi:hypothetical protein